MTFDEYYTFKDHDFGPDNEYTLPDYAHGPDGLPVGDRELVQRLWDKYRVLAETHSLGFSKEQQKWYGWSHRAIFGFGIGDVVKEGDCTASSGMTEEGNELFPEDDISLPVGFKAETLLDAKHMAQAFAESVS